MKALLTDALLTPWRSTRAARRWFALSIALLCILGAVAVGVFMPGPRRWAVCAVLYAVGVFFLWAMWLSATVILAVDAHRLGLPRVQKAAIQGLACYAALTVGLPMVALAALPNANVAWVALIATTAPVGALAFALLPRYVIALAGLLPLLYSNLKAALHLPSLPGLSGQGWLAATLIVLAAVVALRWRQLVHGGAIPASGFRRPLVMQLHQTEQAGFLGDDPGAGSVQMIRQRPSWLQPRAALCDAGPRSRGLALRIALGGHYLPKTWASHLQTTTLALLGITAMGLLSTLMFANKHGWATLQTNLVLVALAYIGGTCVLTAPMAALLISTQLHQRWRQPQAELPLLALLPGLGDAVEQRRQLLRTTLEGPAVSFAALLAITLAAALAMHRHGVELLLLALPTLASLAVIAVQALRIYGGCLLPMWDAWLLFVPLTALLGLSLLLPALSILGYAVPVAVEVWLLAAWGVAAWVLTWVGRRGWHAFQHRPHPFLPIAA